jgi:hypothetical protein
MILPIGVFNEGLWWDGDGERSPSGTVGLDLLQ